MTWTMVLVTGTSWSCHFNTKTKKVRQNMSVFQLVYMNHRLYLLPVYDRIRHCIRYRYSMFHITSHLIISCREEYVRSPYLLWACFASLRNGKKNFSKLRAGNHNTAIFAVFPFSSSPLSFLLLSSVSSLFLSLLSFLTSFVIVALTTPIQIYWVQPSRECRWGVCAPNRGSQCSATPRHKHHHCGRELAAYRKCPHERHSVHCRTT